MLRIISVISKFIGGEGVFPDIIKIISGMIASALLGRYIDAYSLVLISAIVFIIIMAVIYFARIDKLVGENCKQIRELIDARSKLTVAFVNEQLYKNNYHCYRGEIFIKTSEWISKAEKRILILSATFGKEKPVEVAQHATRKKYFEELFKIVETKQNCGSFEYRRINQIPQKQEYPTVAYIGTEATDHSINILNLKKKIEPNPNKAVLSVRKVKFVKLTSLWIIDDKYVITEVSGQDSEGHTYPEGRFFFEDHSGDLVQSYTRYFGEIEDNSEELTIEELKDCSNGVNYNI